MIYALPANPTARDIIERSIVAHPTLFGDMLRAREVEDAQYASTTNNLGAQRGARASAAAYKKVRSWLERWDLSESDRALAIVTEGTGPAVVALNTACKLQCLPPHVRTAAAVALDAEARS